MAYLYYMKKIFFAVSFLLCSIGAALAQKDSLQTDETNKYVYYRVIEKSGISNDTLHKRALAFIYAIEARSNGKTEMGTIVAKGKFLVYGSALVSKKEAGEITYQISIDTKDEKYRYKFSDFVFTPFKIDRYGSMVAVPGIYIPAEKINAKYSRKDADAYLDQIGAYCRDSARQLGSYMDKVQVPKKPEPVKKVYTDKW